MNEQLHISSIVVTADPDRLDIVEPAIEALGIAEIAVRGPGGKLIVTLETGEEQSMVQALTDIQLMPGVASAALVYHQTTREADALAALENAGSPI
ncbi:MAG: chaperone NapD [Rhizobiaceae bacterium]